MTVRRSLLAAALLTLPAPVVGSVGTVADSLVGPGPDIPFVAQGPLLCGGAAAAMLERFWGARGVWAESYADLVRAEEGGIRTDELARAMDGRGLEVSVHTGDPDIARRALDRGIPVMLLIESDRVRRHYVVLHTLAGDTARLHDPAWGPDRALPWTELRRRWAVSGYWALVVTGSARLAPRAEAPRVDLPAGAVEALRAGHTDTARAMADHLLQGGDPDPETGWRLLATARWLDGDTDGALAAWNRVGEPPLDLLETAGLSRTRFHAVEARAGLEPGRPLTPAALALARRRVRTLPTLAAARVSYRPEEDGSATVRVAVREHPATPLRTGSAVAAAAEAAFRRGVTLGFGPFTGAAERWTLEGSWDPARRTAGLGASLPGPGGVGIVTVRGEWRRERYAPSAGSADHEQVRRAAVEIDEWLHPHWSVGAGLGLERWSGGDMKASVMLRGGFAAAGDRVAVAGALRGWTGDSAPFARAELTGEVRSGDRGESGWTLRSGVTVASAHAPRLVWPGAGSGRARAPLLRAHGLVEDGRIAGPVFGRGVAHATLERIQRLWRLGPLGAGWIVFMDVAGAWSTVDDGTAGPFLDVGSGFRVHAGDRELDLTLAHGAPGWRWNVTARTSHFWPGR